MLNKFNSFKENRFVFEAPGEVPKWHPPMPFPEGPSNLSDGLQEVRDARKNFTDDIIASATLEVRKGDEMIKAMSLLGISQEKLNIILNDETNPYATWVVDFLASFVKQELVLKSRPNRQNSSYLFSTKNMDVSFPISNLDRAFQWKDKVLPRLLGIIGKDNYEKYDAVIWDAVQQDAPIMAEFLDLVCDSTVSIKNYSNINALVKAELDKLLAGTTVSQLKQQARMKKGTPATVETDPSTQTSVQALSDLVKNYKPIKLSPSDEEILRGKADLSAYDDVLRQVPDVLRYTSNPSERPPTEVIDEAMGDVGGLLDEVSRRSDGALADLNVDLQNALLAGEDLSVFRDRVRETATTIPEAGEAYNQLYKNLLDLQEAKDPLASGGSGYTDMIDKTGSLSDNPSGESGEKFELGGNGESGGSSEFGGNGEPSGKSEPGGKSESAGKNESAEK